MCMATELKTIFKLSVPVIVQVGERSLPVDDVLALGPGAILELNRSSESELDLLVHNKRVGQGSAVKVGENFGLKITRIDAPRDRITAMGPG